MRGGSSQEAGAPDTPLAYGGQTKKYSVRCRPPSQGCREIRFNGQNVALAVHEDGEGLRLAHMLGHQPEHRLVGVDMSLWPDHKHPRTPEHERTEHRRGDPPLAAAVGRGSGLLTHLVTHERSIIVVA